MPHFFINSNQVKQNNVVISDKDNYLHISRSLRARTGEKLLLIDENEIQYETVIKNITSSEISAEILKSYKSEKKLDFELYLVQSPLRSDSQNLLIEKATELGVYGIYPVKTDNCALSDDVIEKKIPRWQKIMTEASKQCERAFIPECVQISDLETLLRNSKFDKIIAFCERLARENIRDSFIKNPIKSGDKVLVIIGPEGGFSKKEFELFEKSGVEMLTLGSLILKAETAVIVALGNIIYEYSTHKK